MHIVLLLCGVLLQETTSSFLIAIRNVGTASVYLKKCLPLRDVRAFAFSDRSSCTMLNDQYGNQEIKPGTNQKFSWKINSGYYFNQYNIGSVACL